MKFKFLSALTLLNLTSRAAYPFEYGQSSNCDTFITTGVQSGTKTILIGQTNDLKLMDPSVYSATECASSQVQYVAFFDSGVLQWNQFYKQDDEIKWVSFATTDGVILNPNIIGLKLYIAETNAQFLIVLQASDGEIQFANVISNLALSPTNIILYTASQTSTTTAEDYGFIYSYISSHYGTADKIKVQKLIAAENSLSQWMVSKELGTKYLAVDAITMASSNYIAIGAHFDSNPAVSNTCSLISVGIIKLDSTEMVMEHALAVNTCTTDYKIHSMQSKGAGSVYAVGNVPTNGCELFIIVMRYDGNNIGCYIGTMSTFKLENFGYLFILGMTSDVVSKTIDVIADKYQTEADYTNGVIKNTPRYQFRGMFDTTCSSAADVANNEAAYRMDLINRFCPKDITKCKYQVLLNFERGSEVSVVSTIEYQTTNSYNSHFSIYVYEPTLIPKNKDITFYKTKQQLSTNLFVSDWQGGLKYEGINGLYIKRYLAPQTINFDQNTIGEFEIEVMKKLRKSLIEQQYLPFGSQESSWINYNYASIWTNYIYASPTLYKFKSGTGDAGSKYNLAYKNYIPNGVKSFIQTGYNINALGGKITYYRQILYVNFAKIDCTTLPPSPLTITWPSDMKFSEDWHVSEASTKTYIFSDAVTSYNKFCGITKYQVQATSTCPGCVFRDSCTCSSFTFSSCICVNTLSFSTISGPTKLVFRVEALVGMDPAQLTFVSNEVTIDINNCGTEIVSVSKIQHEITVERKASGSTDVDIEAEVKSFFSSDTPVECPIVSFDLLNADSDVSQNGKNLQIQSANAFTKGYTIQARTKKPKTADLKIYITVCGAEEIELKDEAEVVVLNSTKNEMYQIDALKLFKVSATDYTASDGYIVQNKCGIIKSIDFAGITSPQLSFSPFSQSDLTYIISIDKSTPLDNQSLTITASTLGLKSASKKYIFTFCDTANSLQITPIKLTFELKSKSDKLTKFLKKTDIENSFVMKNCEICTIKSYELKDDGDGSDFKFNADDNVEIQVSDEMQKSFKVVAKWAKSECETMFAGAAEMEVSIEVTVLPEEVVEQLVEKEEEEIEEVFEDKCTKDNITLANQGSLKVDFSKLGEENVYQLKQPQIEKLFKISNAKCLFTKFHVSMNEASFGPIPIEYDVFINSQNSLEILNTNGAAELNFFLTCTSNQGFRLSKKFTATFKNPDQQELDKQQLNDLKPTAKDNKAPKFESELEPITIVLNYDPQTDEILEIIVNQQTDINQINLPIIIDLESDAIVLKAEKVCNGCLELVQISEKEYVVQINQITLDNVGDLSIKIVLKDDKSKFENVFTQVIKIQKIEKKQGPEPVTLADLPEQYQENYDESTGLMGDTFESIPEQFREQLVVSKPNKSLKKSKFTFENEKDRTKNFDGNIAPLNLKFNKFTRNGLLKIDILNSDQFADPAKRNLNENKTKEELLFNIENYLDFKLISQHKLNYTVYLKSLTFQQMQIQFDFQNPLEVSNLGFTDSIQMIVKNHDLFKLKIHENASIHDDNRIITTKIPKQFLKSIDAEKVEEQAKTQVETVTSLMIIQLVLQIFLKGSLDKLWSMFFTFQLICYFQIYYVASSAFSEVYLEQLTKLIEFDILNPDGLIRMFLPGYTVKTLIKNTFFQEMFMYIFMGAVFVAIVLVLLLLQFIPGIKHKVRAKLLEIKNQTFWNGIIRSIMISYLPTCIVPTHLEKIHKHDQAISMALFCTMIWIGSFIFMRVNRNNLKNEEFKQMYDKLYEQVQIKDKRSLRIYFGPMFFLRRYLYVVYPFVFNSGPIFQIQSICFQTELYIIYYVLTKPHMSKIKTNVEVFNDVIFMFMIYHLICYSDFNLSLTAKFQMGYSQIILIGALIVLNIIVMVITSIHTIKRNKINQAIDNAKQKRLAEHNEISALLVSDLILKLKMKVKSNYLKDSLKQCTSKNFQFQDQDYNGDIVFGNHNMMSTISEGEEPELTEIYSTPLSTDEAETISLPIKFKNRGMMIVSGDDVQVVQKQNQIEFLNEKYGRIFGCQDDVCNIIQDEQYTNKVKVKDFSKNVLRRADAGIPLRKLMRANLNVIKRRDYFQRKKSIQSQMLKLPDQLESPQPQKRLSAQVKEIEAISMEPAYRRMNLQVGEDIDKKAKVVENTIEESMELPILKIESSDSNQQIIDQVFHQESFCSSQQDGDQSSDDKSDKDDDDKITHATSIRREQFQDLLLHTNSIKSNSEKVQTGQDNQQQSNLQSQQDNLQSQHDLFQSQRKINQTAQARALNLKKMKRKQAMFQKNRQESFDVRSAFYAKKQSEMIDIQDLGGLVDIDEEKEDEDAKSSSSSIDN